MQSDNNPYSPPPVETRDRPKTSKWNWAHRFWVTGIAIGFTIPIANVLYVMIWMWSRPPPPLGTALSATRLVAALLVAMVSCPALALFFGAVGVLIGAVVDWFASRGSQVKSKQIDSEL